MGKRKLQIRIVTGKGFFRDQDFGAYEGLQDEEFVALARHYELAAMGTVLDFLEPEKLRTLLEHRGELSEQGLRDFQTVVDGEPLPPGTAYGVLLEDLDSLEVERLQAKLRDTSNPKQLLPDPDDNSAIELTRPSGAGPGD